MSGLKRSAQRTGVIYITPSGGVFFTPDGEGRIWYDSLAECKDDYLDWDGRTVIRLAEEPEDAPSWAEDDDEDEGWL